MRKRKSGDSDGVEADHDLPRAIEELERRNATLEHLLREQQDDRAAMLRMFEDQEEGRGKIERARREWSATFDAIRDPVFLHDAEFRILRANRAYAERAGLAVQEVIGKPYWQVFPKNSGPLPCCARAAEKSAAAEEEVSLATGEVLRSRTFAVRDERGGYLYSVHVLEDVTEKRRAEQALKEQERAYRTLAENLPGIVYRVYVRDGNRIQFFNRVAADVTGYTPEELTGGEVCSIDPIILPEDRPQVVAEVKRAVREARRFTVEYRLRTKSGDIRHMLEQGTPIDGPDGRPLYIDGVIFDITERRLAEQALHDSEEKFRGINTAAQDAVLMIDDDGKLTYWNPAAERILGYRAADVLGRELHPLIAPARYHAAHAKGWPVFRETGAGSLIGNTLELAAVHKDGREIPIELSVSALNLKGRWSAVGILRDITARKQAETRLQQSEERFRGLVEASSDWIWEVDQHGVYTYVSPRVRDVLGYDPEEVLGRTPFDLMPPEEAGRVAAVFQEIAAERRPFSLLENTNRHKNGQLVVLETSGMPIFGADGTLRGYRGVDRDITARRRAAEALRKSAAELKDAQRVARLGNWDLDTATGNVTWSEELYRIFGRDPAQPVPGYEEHTRILAPESYARMNAAIEKTRQTGEPYELDLELVRPDGTRKWITARGEARRDSNGEIVGLLGTALDITERKQIEESLRRANRALKTLSAGNTALVHAQSEPALLQEICRVIVETGGYAYAWIGYAERDEAKRIKPMAQMGFENGFLDKLPFTWSETERGRGPSGTAIREGMVMVTRDAAADPSLSAWRDEVMRLGIGSGCALPLISDDETFGVLTMYAHERGAFDKDELMLLAELADDLNFGILTLRARVAHERLQEAHLKSAERLRETLIDTIRAVSLTVEKRDPYTAGHQNKVAELCVAIGHELGMDEDRLEGLRLGATIHDIGKVYIPAEILNRPGKLSAPEFEIIKTHPEVGYDIIKGIKFPWPVGQIIMQHHERLDGSGYPKGLKADEIILEARILAVADTVEAMMSHRPYRPGLGLDVALAQIQEKRGSWYDPAATDACVRLFRERGFKFE